MPVQQTQTTGVNEATASVAGGSATQALVDLVSLYSVQLAQAVVRQVVAIGDPANPTGVMNVGATLPSGVENAGFVRQSPGGPEMQMIIQELRNLRAEMQSVVIALGGLPATASPLQETLTPN
jgi:hypothetical protein